MSVTTQQVPTYVSVVDVIQPFLFGGCAGIVATTCIQPLDTIKVRIQGSTVPGTLIGTGRGIIEKEGYAALYSGYSAAVLRQAVYGTARLGLFRTFSNKLQKDEHTPLPFYKKAMCGLASGALGSVIGNPADLSLVRMQADGQLPAAQQRKYTSAFNAIARIAKEEGVATLWRGSLPSVYRAMAMNCGMLATYDEAKEILTGYLGPSQLTNLSASVVSGVVAATVTLPFDLIKTRIQRMVPLPDGSMPYKGVVDCAMKTVAEEGTFALWKGLSTFCVRVAPHAVITLLCLDAMNANFKSWRSSFPDKQ